jgi:hypothetical protein
MFYLIDVFRLPRQQLHPKCILGGINPCGQEYLGFVVFARQEIWRKSLGEVTGNDNTEQGRQYRVFSNYFKGASAYFQG